MMSESGSVPSILTRREHVLAGTYRLFYDDPLTVAQAHGVRITDASGAEYLDAYNNVPCIGHSDAEVAEAVHSEMLRANTHTRYADEGVVAYAEALLAHFPEPLDRAAFTCSGSEANDLALQLARHATGARGIIVTEHAYHGTTTAVREVSPSLVGRDGIADYAVTVAVPRAGAEDERAAQFAQSVADAMKVLESRGYGVAALLIDTALTSDGIFAPATFIADAAALVQEHGGLVIADEVQAGFCRTGRWWGFAHAQIVPDLVTLGKPMANGMPMAGVVGPAVLFERFGREFRYFNTFAGTAAPVAAASVVLRRLESMAAPDSVTQLGEQLRSGLSRVFAAHGGAAQVRGAGLMVGVDLDPTGENPAAAGAQVRALVNGLRSGGVLVSHTGPNGEALKIRPPLCIQSSEINEIVAAVDRVLAEISEPRQ
ncbi:aminotransferase class III-fold pyridoxal phosphate-dependent enzyme [Gulosibacter sp. GYB002]|uniref:aspartate aminotransferase family protein n=1 Tax=Gulosibacter sp. GYB002 TaxID=2994391 RepID=UPI002F96C0DE